MSLMMEYAFGFDYGNAESGGVYINYQGMKSSRVFPSTSAAGSLKDLALKRSALGHTYVRDFDALSSQEHVIERNGSEFFIGELALREKKSASTRRGDISRYWGDNALNMLLALSGDLIPDKDYILHVVTGLPVETFTSENRTLVKEALEGDYDFVLDGKRRHAIIIVERVVMEGAGAMVLYGESKDVLQGVIDIGGRTIDLYVARKQKAISELCRGKPYGVGAVADIISSYFELHHGRPLKADETHEILRNYVERKPLPILVSNGLEIGNDELRGWIATAIAEVAHDIVSFISTTWNTSERGAIAADINPVLIVGGGAYYFASSIQDHIRHAIVPHAPEMANAEGYASIARVAQIKYKRETA